MKWAGEICATPDIRTAERAVGENMTKRMSVSRGVRLFAVLAVSMVGVGVARGGDPAPEPLIRDTADASELWKRGSDQVLAGDFKSARATMERIASRWPDQSQAVAALKWLRDTEELQASRERLRIANFDQQVDLAKTQAKKENWSKALQHVTLALQNHNDRDQFANQDWVLDIVNHAKDNIKAHRDKGEWTDALILYDRLLQLYPKDKNYKDGFRVCRQRAHFEVIYGPKTTWRNDLQGVKASTVPELIERIDGEYVSKPSFPKMAHSALENLQILAETAKIKSEFPSLADSDRVSQFTKRVKALRERRIDQDDEFLGGDLKAVFSKLLDINKDTIDLPEQVIADEFVSGMLEPLDEFTSVIWPSEVDEFNKHTRGEFVGVGIQITKPNEGEFIRVESPLEDSPAYKAGVKPGDMIAAINGESTKEISITQAVTKITGRPGSNVTLSIQDGVTEKVRDISLKREQIKIRTVRGDKRDPSKSTGWDYIIEPDTGIGYVRVSGFMEGTVDDLEAALKQMRKDGAKGLILDLRFNPGGLLTAAKEMCELFLPEDAPIAKTSGRARRQDMELHANPAGENFHNLPIIVLVNEYSASASEIVAGALAGLKEACVIGERTFGKGSVQNLIPVADHKAYLKLTTAHYYVPDNDSADHWYCLNKEEDAANWGVDPHIAVKVIPQEIGKVLKLRRQRDLLKGKDQETLPEDVLERRPTTQPTYEEPKDEHADTDPQIAVAVNVMRMKLMSKQPWALAPRQQRALSRANGPVKIESKTE